MNLNAPVHNLTDRLLLWTSSTIDATRFLLLRKFFTAIWILYDISDLLLKGAPTIGWRLYGSPLVHYYTGLQIVLVILETTLFLNYYPRLSAFLCFLCRGTVATYWPLNDFLFYCVVMLLFTQCKISPCTEKGVENSQSRSMRVLKWPIDTLNAQIAWVYFTTAVLKINPVWMSGGGLYVRIQEAKMFLGRTYPSYIEKIFSDLSYLSILARTAIIGELVASFLILYCLRISSEDRYPRFVLCLLVCCIHIFAALTVNVFFFGAVMISIVLTLNFPESDRVKN